MKAIPTDTRSPLGGILHRDNDHEIVQLTLQPGNEIPPYRHNGTILLIALSGHAEVSCNGQCLPLNPTQMLSIAPEHIHSIRALAPDTVLIAVKHLPKP